jgi:adenosylmethionine---8-amino-7-oxononanoate aminotransferase
MNDLAIETSALDHRYVWHPFTDMRQWLAASPLVVVGGRGCWLYDANGRKYLDGNASIWTNIHGHNHPKLNAALTEQAGAIAHSSFLGLTNPPAARLAAQLVALLPASRLGKVFFSDNGSTAVEVALKMAVQSFQLMGRPKKNGFATFDAAYHGDTVGASSLGGIGVFHDRFASLHFPVQRIADPNQLDRLEPAKLAGLIIEPIVQGAAGIRLWPRGTLKPLREWCDENEVWLIFDEVLTGFGRTGRMFACEHENVFPDFLVLAKGLTGGYLPLGATITTDQIFNQFLGEPEDMKTFFYGHSYAGNALGCAVALANLEVFAEENTLEVLAPKIVHLTAGLERLRQIPAVKEVRQAGFIAGIELGKRDGSSLDWREFTGARVCLRAREYQLLTRPIRDVVVLLLPLCATEGEIDLAIEAIGKAVQEVVG